MHDHDNDSWQEMECQLDHFAHQDLARLDPDTEQKLFNTNVSFFDEKPSPLIHTWIESSIMSGIRAALLLNKTLDHYNLCMKKTVTDFETNEIMTTDTKCTPCQTGFHSQMTAGVSQNGLSELCQCSISGQNAKDQTVKWTDKDMHLIRCDQNHTGIKRWLSLEHNQMTWTKNEQVISLRNPTPDTEGITVKPVEEMEFKVGWIIIVNAYLLMVLLMMILVYIRVYINEVRYWCSCRIQYSDATSDEDINCCTVRASDLFLSCDDLVMDFPDSSCRTPYSDKNNNHSDMKDATSDGYLLPASGDSGSNLSDNLTMRSHNVPPIDEEETKHWDHDQIPDESNDQIPDESNDQIPD